MQVYKYTGTYDGVSNLTSYTDSVMGIWSFGYDHLNRLNTTVVLAPNRSKMAQARA